MNILDKLHQNIIEKTKETTEKILRENMHMLQHNEEGVMFASDTIETFLKIYYSAVFKSMNVAVNSEEGLAIKLSGIKLV